MHPQVRGDVCAAVPAAHRHPERTDSHMPAWNFEDFLRRLEAIKEIGSLEELVEQVPGLAAILEQVDFRLEELEPIEGILRAMTLDERLHPQLLEGEAGRARRERIATTARTTIGAVDDLLDQFHELRALLEKAANPEEVTDEVLKQIQPELEDWQTSPDAWKGEPQGEPQAGWQVGEGVALPVTDESEVEELEPVDAEEAEFQGRLDGILRRLSSVGMEGLTPEERAFLQQASARLRARRA